MLDVMVFVGRFWFLVFWLGSDVMFMVCVLVIFVLVWVWIKIGLFCYRMVIWVFGVMEFMLICFEVCV